MRSQRSVPERGESNTCRAHEGGATWATWTCEGERIWRNARRGSRETLNLLAWLAVAWPKRTAVVILSRGENSISSLSLSPGRMRQTCRRLRAKLMMPIYGGVENVICFLEPLIVVALAADRDCGCHIDATISHGGCQQQ